MWGSKVIKFQACFNYIWKQLLSTWLPRFFRYSFSLLFSICSFQTRKKILNHPTICFYCTQELTPFNCTRWVSRKKEWLTSELRAQFTNWCKTFRCCFKNNENYVRESKTTSLNYRQRTSNSHEFESQKSKCLHLKKDLPKWITWCSYMSIQLH